MSARRIAAAALCAIGIAPVARAQEPYNITASVKNLATLFTDLYGPRGLIVDSEATLPGEQPHSAHFNSDFQLNFRQFSTALVSQLVSVPLPSPASGFTYRFDPTLGVFERSTQSYGPILADRADTIGARRVSFGFTFQRFTFDTVEGLSLRSVPSVFTHDNAFLLGGRQDVVTTSNSIEATVSQATTFVTLGISDRLDVSVAVPVVSNNLKVVSDATIHRLGTTNPLTHFFRLSNGDVGDRRIFTAIGSATGLGDLTIRVKQTAYRSQKGGMAIGVDVRVPTGDEMNLLGSGAPGIQPFAIWSAAYNKVAPHVNVSYKWNGSSVLAGNPAAGQSADFPDQIGYAAGADLSVNSRLTLAFDVLGRYDLRAERLRQQPFHALDGTSVFPNVTFARDSFNLLSGAIGFKVGVQDRLLFDVNVLFKLDDHGLRDKVTPLVGLEYAF
jgi:outer membrane putative beta-barrel porin/alpha-amylase